MKILVITGSPHRSGTTARLTEQFIKGAEEAGNEVARFDSAFKSVHPCIACDKCKSGSNVCVFGDDMKELNPILIAADAVVFVSPIYYYAMTGQIKTVIDRFYANDDALHNGKKAALILTMADNTEEAAAGAIGSYKGMTDFLGWKDAGMLIATDCGTVADLEKYDYLTEAYELGKSMGKEG